MSGSQQLLLGGVPTVPAVDPYFYSVTSLLHGDGTNGGQNNTFLDSSTNNFTITRNGNTTQGSFSPFSQTGWSNYFDGNGDYLSIADNVALDLGTGDFTIEGWVYFSAAGSDADGLISKRDDPTFTNGAWRIAWDATNKKINIACADENTTRSTPAVSLHSWVHFAFVRSGSTLNCYANGLLGDQDASWGHNLNNAYTLLIGANVGGSNFLTGYLSNIRILKGTALYSGATYTVPTTPLTAITNTSLLTCQSNRFIDNSTNAFAITRNGDVSVQPFSPFNPTTAYSTSSIGGSGYFDGSGDFLTVPSNAAFAYGTGALTIEAFINTTTKVDFQSIIGSFDSVGWFLHTTATGVVLAGLNSGTFITGTKNVCDGAWHHVAMVRSGSTLTLYIDGVSDGAISDSTNVSSTTEVRIGGLSAGIPRPLTGYISSLRVVKGTAVYTANFTPPTAPLTAITNTSLLTNFTNGAIFDNAAVADYETVGNAQISTSVKKYGTGSMSFDGNGDYLFTPSNQTLAFGTADFTIEFWVYFNSVGTTQSVFDFRPNATTSSASPSMYLDSAALNYYVSGASRIVSGALSASTWYHIAICRVASQTRLFVNGTQSGSTYADTTSYLQSGAAFGFNRNNGGTSFFYLNGYIDDFRSSNGIGRYPYNFTPPTAEFPNIGGTVTLTADPYFDYTTLLLPGNGTNGAQNNTFLDSSANAFSITRNGNTTQGTFSPFSQTGWGNYFDGSGDYLSLADNAALNLGTGDFTLEGWVYITGFPGSNAVAMIAKWASGNYAYIVQILSPSTLRLYTGNSGSLSSFYDHTYTWQRNSWTHIAITRESSTLRFFVNGLLIGSNSSITQSLSNSSSFVLGQNLDGGGQDFTGYMSNVRVVKGTAVYTANFTPPTTPLTAITNTSLLTCQSNRFIDNSTNAFAITRNGDVSVQAFSPFNPTASWSAATNGGSGYFDGSGDWLSAPANTAFDFGTGAFTIEAWVYLSTVANNASVFVPASYGGVNGDWILRVAPGGGSAPAGTWEFTTFWGGTAYQAYSNSSATAGSWIHLAGVRNGNTFTLYVNGVAQTATATNSNSVGFNNKATLICGDNSSGVLLTGYVSSARIVKGTAVYTAAFTPPTAPLTAIANTSLLLNYTNAGIYDATSKNDLETVGNAQISTTQSKFGGSSMYFDGSGDYLLGPWNPLTDLGAGDFTIEFWMYPTAVGQSSVTYLFNLSTSGAFGPILIGQAASGYGIVLYSSSTGSSWNLASGSSFGTATANAWNHVALTRYGADVRLFLNGVVGTTLNWGTTALLTGSTYRTNIGSATGVANTFYTGYMQDVRVTKGIARYTSNFTPPTTAFLTL